MPTKELEELRRTLHAQVDGAWAKPEMLDAKDALSKIARDAIEKCYEKCMEQGGDVKNCYKKRAEEAGLGDKFREEWGKGKSVSYTHLTLPTN